MASFSRIANRMQFLRLTSLTTSSSSPPVQTAFAKYSSTKKSIKSTTAAAAAVLFTAKSESASQISSTTTELSKVNLNTRRGLNSTHSDGLFQQQQFRRFSSLQGPLQMHSTRLLAHHNTMVPLESNRYVCSRTVTKNLTLYTSEPFKSEIDPKTLECKNPTGNPLVVLMAWLLAKQKHLKKYAEIYNELGFDVVVVHITPWQLLWPVKGTQVVAAETIKFLENNKSYNPIIIHGFSVGAYQFGEIMVQMARDMERYNEILNRFACQIWDSAADITEIPVGLPKSIFPRNPRMQSALRNYVEYHLKTFHNQATIHYMRSSQMFHSTLVKKPALFFVSENDLVGPPKSNHMVRENWERADINVTFKCWEKSLHASHLIKHRDEYLTFLFQHLENAGVLQTSRLKSRAKL